jgi:hypothetical protein
MNLPFLRVAWYLERWRLTCGVMNECIGALREWQRINEASISACDVEILLILMMLRLKYGCYELCCGSTYDPLLYIVLVRWNDSRRCSPMLSVFFLLPVIALIKKYIWHYSLVEAKGLFDDIVTS